jgi:hypothetical protein
MYYFKKLTYLTLRLLKNFLIIQYLYGFLNLIIKKSLNIMLSLDYFLTKLNLFDYKY